MADDSVCIRKYHAFITGNEQFRIFCISLGARDMACLHALRVSDGAAGMDILVFPLYWRPVIAAIR